MRIERKASVLLAQSKKDKPVNHDADARLKSEQRGEPEPLTTHTRPSEQSSMSSRGPATKHFHAMVLPRLSLHEIKIDFVNADGFGHFVREPYSAP